MLSNEEKHEQAKTLFKSVYNEDPSTFKKEFQKIIGERIKEKIDQREKEIVESLDTTDYGLDEEYIEDTDEYLTDNEEYESEEDFDTLEEVAAKKTMVVRGGKRMKKYVCPSGYKLDGKKCIKMSSSEKTKLSKQAKKAAKKRKSGQAAANRKRAKSLKKR
jgi:hypothetical protein